MNKFIKLTDNDGRDVFINIDNICSVEPYDVEIYIEEAKSDGRKD